MNKLSRERVKNNFKWIYVQPTSLSLEIDGFGTVLNCVLFSFPPPRPPPHPSPVSEGASCQGALERQDISLSLTDAALPESTLLHLFDRLRTLV